MPTLTKATVKSIEPSLYNEGYDAVVEINGRLLKVQIEGPEHPEVGDELETWISLEGETVN